MVDQKKSLGIPISYGFFKVGAVFLPYLSPDMSTLIPDVCIISIEEDKIIVFDNFKLKSQILVTSTRMSKCHFWLPTALIHAPNNIKFETTKMGIYL
jgi:hypothetical protein